MAATAYFHHLRKRVVLELDRIALTAQVIAFSFERVALTVQLVALALERVALKEKLAVLAVKTVDALQEQVQTGFHVGKCWPAAYVTRLCLPK